VAKQKQEETTEVQEPEVAGYQPTEGQEPGPSAATLEEALRQQDAANREASEQAADESGAAKAEADAEAAAAIEEAGKAQEARDDEVYGRTPPEPVETEEPVTEA